MIKRYFPLVLPCAVALMISGCTDDNYDLANIDVTSKVPVNQLVVPVNLTPITLDQIIDIKDDTEHFEVQDGQYVFFYDGDFESDKIHINAFHVARPENLEPTYFTVTRPSDLPALRKAPGDEMSITYVVEDDKGTSFSYNVTGVDDKVESVNEVQTFNDKGGKGASLTFTTTLNIPTAMTAGMEKLHIENLTVKFPAGLYDKDGKNPVPVILTPGISGSVEYVASTGILTINNIDLPGNSLELRLAAEIIDTEAADIVLANGTFDYNGEITVLKGSTFQFTPRAGVIPADRYEMTTTYSLSDFDILGFTGGINYTLDDVSFDDVELTDLPDFLNQDGTNISLVSPQLYLALNNSCSKYNLGGESGLTITSYRNGIPGTPLHMNEDMDINAANVETQFAISPQGRDLAIPASVSKDYSNIKDANKLLFSDFGSVLEGDGIPQQIAVDFTGARVFGVARTFPLLLESQNPDIYGLDGLSGKYRFRAPLQLGANSRILYSSTTKEWDSEALQDLHINSLKLKSNVSSNVPVNVKLGILVYDNHGFVVGKSEEDIDVAAMSQDNMVDFVILPVNNSGAIDTNGEITGIDKIKYTVTAFTEGSASSEPLNPDQTLTLSQIRATIDGYYLYTDKDDK